MVTAAQPVCPTCGASVSIAPGQATAICQYCQNQVVLQREAPKPLPQWQPPAGAYGAPPAPGPPGWGAPGYVQHQVHPAQFHQAQLHLQAQQAQQASQVGKWIIWIVVLTTVVPIALTFFFIMLGMCAAFSTVR
jgi:hypothetical protein